MAELPLRVAIWHPPNPEAIEVLRRLATERYPEHQHVFMVDQYFEGDGDVTAHPVEVAMVMMGQEKIMGAYRKRGVQVVVVSLDREAVAPVLQEAEPLSITPEELEEERRKFAVSVGLDPDEVPAGDVDTEPAKQPDAIVAEASKPEDAVFQNAPIPEEEEEPEEEIVDIETVHQIMEQKAPTAIEIVEALFSVPFLCAMLVDEFERARMRKTVLAAITKQIRSSWRRDKERWAK